MPGTALAQLCVDADERGDLLQQKQEANAFG